MPEIFCGHLAWKAESSLSEDELSRKVLGPAVYTNIYCRVQRNRVLFIPVQWEKSGHTDHEANRGGSAVPHDKAVALAACHQLGGLSANPVHRVGEEKLREENRWALNGKLYGKVRQRRAEVRGNSVPLLHMTHFSRILVFKQEFLANE